MSQHNVMLIVRTINSTPIQILDVLSASVQYINNTVLFCMIKTEDIAIVE